MTTIQAFSTPLDIDPATGEIFFLEPSTTLQEFAPVQQGNIFEITMLEQSWTGQQFFLVGSIELISETSARFISMEARDLGQNVMARIEINMVFSVEDLDTISDNALYHRMFAGNDFILGSNFDDVVFGLAGNDHLVGRAGNDEIYGNQGNDIIYANIGDDTAYGGQHDDTLYGGQHADVIYGNFQNDVVYGNLQDDVLYGGQDDDILYGGQDNDILYGNKGNDTLYGNKGDDVLHGGSGLNTLIGGPGADTFYVDGDDIVLDLSDEDLLVWL